MIAEMLAWLAVQVDQDERVARAAGGDHWRASDEGSGIYPEDAASHPGPIISDPYGHLDDKLAAHIVGHDPARVLREVEAKRAILAAVRRYLDPHPGQPCTNVDDPYDSCERGPSWVPAGVGAVSFGVVVDGRGPAVGTYSGLGGEDFGGA